MISAAKAADLRSEGSMPGGKGNGGRIEDLTVRILREIRDEIREVKGRLDQTNERLDQTNARLDQTNARLDQTNAKLDGGFEKLGRRIDNLLLGTDGQEHTDFRERLDRIEEHLGLPHPPG